MQLSTHSGRLERWLGPEAERISRAMRGGSGAPRWYGGPIAVGRVPGSVFVHADGDFRGPIRSGYASSLLDLTLDELRRRWGRFSRGQLATVNTGFASYSDLIAKATQSAPGLQGLNFQKTGTTQAQFYTSSFWQNGTMPPAGAAGSAAPGGRAPTSATTGALQQINAQSGQTLSWLSAMVSHSAGGSLLLYDRIFDVAKTMSSTGTEAVTGVPTRYQNTSTTAADYAGNNFLFMETWTALGATAHNWTVCKYTNQAGTAGQTMPSLSGVSAQIINALDIPVTYWFCPLASGDTGISALTQMQCSASVTGAVNFVIGHPIAFLPAPAPFLMTPVNGIKDAFQLTRIFDNACLAFLNITAQVTSAPATTGVINVCPG